ncbi:MAG: TetR/AcrR family transcriptional regulator [Eubacteriales bacterium]|nr:TetR/AcrR family transcriptional regulator [Eubacteriales bacterium]
MNRQITTEEAILNISKKYILKNGISSFNIRRIAKECGISVGTLYNYFPSKTQLIISTVESVWREIFEPFDHLAESDHFIEVVQRMYEIIENGNTKYPGFFSFHSLNFAAEGKKEGIEMMNLYFSKLKENLLDVLRKDTMIKKDLFHHEFTDEKLIDYIFTLMVSSLLNREDPSPLFIFISNYIYR